MSDVIQKSETALFESVYRGDRRNNHRESQYMCPHCGKGDWNDWNLWFSEKYIKQLFVSIGFNKIDSVVIISSCPWCGEFSWVHEDLMGILDIWIKEKRLGVQLILDEMIARWEHTEKNWLESECRACSKVKSTQTDSLPWSAFMSCSCLIGLRPKIIPEDKKFFYGDRCEKFTPKNGKPNRHKWEEEEGRERQERLINYYREKIAEYDMS